MAARKLAPVEPEPDEVEATDDPREAEALGLDVEFEALGQTWRMRGPRRQNNVTMMRFARRDDELGLLEYLFGEEQIEELEELVDDIADEGGDADAAQAEFMEAMSKAGGSPGESRALRRSSRRKAKR